MKQPKIGDIVMLTRAELIGYDEPVDPGSIGEILHYEEGVSWPWEVQFEEEDTDGHILNPDEFEVLP